MSTTDALLEQLHYKVAADPRVAAAWLGGSYGRGDADRYSDLDVHVLLAAGGNSLREEMESLLHCLRPLVLYKLLFDGRMVNALTIDGVRLDIWLHDQAPPLDPAKNRVLFDRVGVLQSQPSTAANIAAGEEDKTRALLRGEIEEFWRCIALLPTVISREEWLVAWRGLAVEYDLALDILLRGHQIVREAGAKKLNQYLPPALRKELESALSLQGLARDSLVNAHLALAALIHEHGPQLAEQWNFDYPAVLEEAVIRYVAEELRLLGIHVV